MTVHLRTNFLIPERGIKVSVYQILTENGKPTGQDLFLRHPLTLCQILSHITLNQQT